ncbi:FAD:protein FMN transferase [Donghicola mangrovi]|uniref:FAD:protein FMN transferase n=1 Tax=Donghicola mangrovi TaxID=2729614 RepID=A0A850Q877_9RHOB|nr:FAD:protein FMN transferase [Donghicola mangrovi]NVO25356.1 FAD:protein FMN transferase [Donghicola mangrovi]
MNRRRFLALSACALATPAGAAPLRWTTRAMGAEVSVTLTGLDAARARRVWRRVARALARIEAAASLHRASDLVRLNRTGVLVNPGRVLRDLVALSDRVHQATGGAFSPCVQSYWADSKNIVTGWELADLSVGNFCLPPGMALTFNGVAQGYAADQLAEIVRAEGLTDVLIDAGEIMALGAHPVGIAAADGTVLKRLALQDRALATSSPWATLLADGRPHILHPERSVLHDTVSVSAPSAALADALSTAFCLMTQAEIDRALMQFPEARVESVA